MSVLRQDDDAADHHPAVRKGIHARGGDGEVVVEEDDVPGVRAVVLVELFPQCDVMLLRHRLDADIVSAGLLPGLGRA